MEHPLPEEPVIPSEDMVAALMGHRFPGGTYRVARWENWLLTDCTGREPLPDGLLHPIILFHVPILGAGTSIAELFRLGGASGGSGSVGLVGYDWEYRLPLVEDVDYRVEGGIVSASRSVDPNGAIDDHVTFRIELSRRDDLAARVTNRWKFRRRLARPGDYRPPTANDATSEDGEPIPPWEMPAVDPARMRTMAAILRDPYPVHWDRSANTRLGFPGRVINQGPLNLGYVANMLMAWAGPASIRRLQASFGPPVLDGDRVIAGGAVTERLGDVAHCDVWLARDGARVVSGRAEVHAPALGAET